MNSIQSIRNKKNTTISYEDRKQIKQLGVPRPHLKIRQEHLIKGKTVVRSFNKNMYKQADWLCGCEVSDSFFCFVCLLMGSSDCDPAWTWTGVTDLKHLGEKIKKHSISQKHLFCSLEFATLGQVDLRNQLSSAYRLEVQKHNEKVKQNRYILDKLINCIKFCGVFELALRGHDESSESNNPGVFRGLVNLMAEVDGVLKSHIENSKNSVFSGLSKTIQNDLLDSILEVSRDLIKKEIQEAEYIAIQADETTDSATISQLVFIVRYVNCIQIRERFVGFIQLPGHNAEEISQVILSELENLNINKTPEKLIAQSYDGAAVMSGKNSGVQAKVKSIYKDANFIHCYAHQLNLLLEKAANQSKQVKVFFANIEGFSTFFSKSPKRTQILENIVSRRLPRGSKTRWNFSSRIVCTVFKYKKEIIECLQYIIDTDADKGTIRQSTGLISYLENPDFNFWLHFFNKLLPHSDILYNQLQQRQLDSIKVQKCILDFKKVIQNIRNEVDYDTPVEDEANEDAVTRRPRFSDNNKQIAKEVCDVIITNIADRFSFTGYFEASLLFEISSFQDYAVSFPDNFFKVAVKYFHLNPMNLKQELIAIYKRDDFRSANGVLHVLQFLLENNLSSVFQETIKLLKIICTIPMTTAESERAFSTLKRVKNFARSTMGQDRLSALAMCSIEKELIQSTENFNELVMNNFIHKKNRRLDFIYKTLN